VHGAEAQGGWVTQKAIIELLEFIGYGRPEFFRSKIEKDRYHHMIFHVTDNPVVEHAARRYGSKSMWARALVDWLRETGGPVRIGRESRGKNGFSYQHQHRCDRSESR
jgi:hypothetical protein